MKKFLSFALALVMILSLGVVAFADESANAGGVQDSSKVTYTATAETIFSEIEKTYNSENSVAVNETLSFTSTASTSNPDGGTANLTVADLTVSSLTTHKLKVTIPSLSEAGEYEWTIKETAGNTAGVTYSTAEVHVIVLVEYDNENHKLVIGNKPDGSYDITSYIKKENGSKAKTFENTFKSGSFTVAKDVIGNMANENDEFEISVTLTSTKPIGTKVNLAGTTVTPSQWTEVMNSEGRVTSWTYTSTLTYSDIAGAKTFADIPTGVTVTVSENKDKMNGYTQNGIYSGDYTVDGTTVTGTGFKRFAVADDNNAKITVVNQKTSTIETGVSMDSIPYVVLLTVACLGLVVLFTKKRAARDF